MEGQIIDLETVDFVQKKKEMSIPLSYLPIKLSTNGKLGVPEVVYCRNFNTEDILTLSMLTNTIIPERMIAVINSFIYGDVNVANWPDKSIIELLVLMYINFFTPMLPQIAFPWNDEDIAWLEERKETKKIDALKKGIWVPRIDLDLRTLDIHQLDSHIQDTIVIKKKDGKGFNGTFLAYPKYGDALILQQMVKDRFEEEEKKYISLELLINSYSRYIESDKDTSELPPIDPNLYVSWQEFLVKKNVFIADATLAYYLQKIGTEDVSSYPIEKKIKLIKDPSFDDINISKKLSKHFGTLDFGISPNVKVHNPITGEEVTRGFQFRVDDILQALQSFDPDGYDISYD